MGTLVGLGVGVGSLLIFSAFALPRPAEPVERPPGRVRRLLDAAGLVTVSTTAFLALCAASFGVVTFVLQVVSQVPTVALAFGVIGGYTPVTVVAARARHRLGELAEVWPEAIDNLASGVRAGLSLPDALAGLAVRGPEPLRAAFDAFALDYQATGRFGDSLDRLKVRLADPVGDRVVEGLRVAREVGGGELGRLLRSLSGYLRDELHTRSELESRQSWAVNGARVAAAAPWVVLLLLSFQPELIERYRSAGGALVLGIGAAVCVVAYRVMMRIGRLPIEKRILA